MTTIPSLLNHSDSSDDGIPNALKPSGLDRASALMSLSTTPEDNPPTKRPSPSTTSVSSGSDSSTPMSSDMSSRPSISSASDSSSAMLFPPLKLHKTSNSRQSDSFSSLERTPVAREPEFLEPRPVVQPIGKSRVPQSKINKELLTKKLVQIAIRRKSVSQTPKFSTLDHPNSKLHIKSLEAGLRVKLTFAPDMISLYNALTPHTTRKRALHVLKDGADPENKPMINNANYLNDINLVTKPVQLIDNNLVNLSGFSNKVLRTFNLNKAHKSKDSFNDGPLPTFNSLNTAVHSLFGIDEYSLVRITRSTTTDLEGSVLLKFETAMPGDYSLIDDDDFTDDFLHSLGKPNDDPGNLFIKKVVARPRYKSDMKIYLIPGRVNCSLYVDKRMLERDLINDVIDLRNPSARIVHCGFDYDEVLDDFKNLLELSEANTNSPSPPASNGITSPVMKQLPRTTSYGVSAPDANQAAASDKGYSPQQSVPGFLHKSRSLLPAQLSHFHLPNVQSSGLMPITRKSNGCSFSSHGYNSPTSTKLPPFNFPLQNGYKSDTNGPPTKDDSRVKCKQS